MVKKLMLNCVGNIFASLGASLMVQAMIGNSTFGAMTYNLSLMTNIKVGDWTIIANGLMIFFQILILKKEFKCFQLLQFVPVYISGKMVNFFLYDFPLISNLSFNCYLLALMIFILALILNALGISLVMKSDLVPFPSEGLSNAIASIYKIPFKIVRTSCDVIFVMIAFICMLFIGQTNAIREGTIINVLLMGLLIGEFNKLLKVKVV